jgi:hypothetical protein
MNSDCNKVKGNFKRDKSVNVDIKLSKGGLNLGYVKSKTTNITYVTSRKEDKAGPSGPSPVTAKEEKPKPAKRKKKNK